MRNEEKLVGQKILSVLHVVGRGEDSLVLSTEAGTFRLYDAGQSCCEHRYMTCDDDLPSYIGGTISSIVESEGPTEDDDWEVHETTFIHINTDRGSIVLCSHNEHNGYYGGFYLVIEEIKQ